VLLSTVILSLSESANFKGFQFSDMFKYFNPHGRTKYTCFFPRFIPPPPETKLIFRGIEHWHTSEEHFKAYVSPWFTYNSALPALCSSPNNPEHVTLAEQCQLSSPDKQPLSSNQASSSLDPEPTSLESPPPPYQL
jgi:hypothetical protein